MMKKLDKRQICCRHLASYSLFQTIQFFLFIYLAILGQPDW
ncbi:hypothetical protein [Bacillus cytotoxicus]